MSGEQKYATHVLYVMDEIKKRSFYRVQGEPIDLYIHVVPHKLNLSVPEPSEQVQIVKQLSQKGAIKIINGDKNNHRIERQVNDDILNPVYYYELEINELEFSEVYKKYKDSIILGVPLDTPNTALFDFENSLLTIGSQEIRVTPETKEFFLCKAIFKNTSKSWDNDQLTKLSGEDPDRVDNKKTAKQFYDAYFRLNKKIKRLTGIPELVLYQNKAYRLNPKISKIVRK